MAEYHYYSGKAVVKAEIDVNFEVLIPVGATKEQSDRLIRAAAINAAADKGVPSLDDYSVHAYEYSRGDSYVREDLAEPPPPHACTNCGVSDEDCNAQVRQSATPCCAQCHLTDTHGALPR
jgi:hypothetical protein